MLIPESSLSSSVIWRLCLVSAGISWNWVSSDRTKYGYYVGLRVSYMV